MRDLLGDLGEVEEEGLGGFVGGEVVKAGGFAAGAVAGGEGLAVEGEGAAHQLEPEAAPGAEEVVDGGAGVEAEAVDFGVLVDGGGVVASVWGDDEDFSEGVAVGLGVPFGVAGDEACLVGEDPDLEEVEVLVGVGVAFAVGDAGAGAHELDVAGEEGAAVAEAVLVGDGAGEDVAEDFHVAVGVGAEAAAGGDVVFVDDAEGAKAHVGGVAVVGKGEGVLGVEPAVVGVAAGGGGAQADGEGGGGEHGMKVGGEGVGRKGE